MNKIKVLIIDDESLARRAVRGLLAKDEELTVVGEAGDGEQALDLIAATKPQLIFLDVQMPIMTGPEMLRQLPPGARPVVVFITAFEEHAIKAFELHAIDYLVKPFTDARFRQALERAKSRARSHTLADTERAITELLEQLKSRPAPAAATPPTMARLVVKADGELHFIEQRDIRWVEGQGDFVKIHTVKQRLLTRLTMASLLEQLDPALFLRIHKSSIVNLSFIRRVKPCLSRSLGVEIDDGTVIPVGRNYRQQFERHFG